MEEGEVKRARHILLLVGQDQFKAPPTPEQQTVIDAILDADRLEKLVVRASHVRSWSELPAPVATPTPRRRKQS